MGEIADAMINGLMCECCGTYMDDGDEPGFARWCSEQCAAGRWVTFEGSDDQPEPTTPRYPKHVKVAKPFSCQVDGCGKRFASEVAKRSHRRMKHGKTT